MNKFILHTIKQLQLLRKRKDMNIPEKFEYSIRLRRRLRDLVEKMNTNPDEK